MRHPQPHKCSLGRRRAYLLHQAKLCENLELVEILVEFCNFPVLELQDDAEWELDSFVGRWNNVPIGRRERSRVTPAESGLRADPVVPAEALLQLHAAVWKSSQEPLYPFDTSISALCRFTVGNQRNWDCDNLTRASSAWV